MGNLNSRIRILSVIFLLLLFTCLWFLYFNKQLAKASPTLTHKIYLPLILKNYKSPPPATVSRYIGYNNGNTHNIDSDKMINMGCLLGEITQPGQEIAIILFFGQHWYQSGEYGVKIFDEPHYSFIDMDTVSFWAKSYKYGFWSCAPVDSHLSLALGTSNYGPYVLQEHGQEWALMVTDVAGYIPSISTYGAIDNELDWNGPGVSLAWATGYGSVGTREYFYFGACEGCPTEANPDWDPNGDWTLEDVYQMSDGKYLAEAFPQIYATDGANAEQWYYLSWYALLNHEYPLTIQGSLTQWNACLERPQKCDPNTDNKPEQGWMQLWNSLHKNPTTIRPLDWSTDISWQN